MVSTFLRRPRHDPSFASRTTLTGGSVSLWALALQSSSISIGSSIFFHGPFLLALALQTFLPLLLTLPKSSFLPYDFSCLGACVGVTDGLGGIDLSTGSQIVFTMVYGLTYVF